MCTFFKRREVDFYIINEWAEAVGRLVDDADMRKLARVVHHTPGFRFGGLNQASLIASLERLTHSILNVDVNHVACHTEETVGLIRALKRQATASEGILLDLVLEKFSALGNPKAPSGTYDHVYFQSQLALVGLLLISSIASGMGGSAPTTGVPAEVETSQGAESSEESTSDESASQAPAEEDGHRL